MTEPIDLDAVKQRAEAATPGPWKHVHHGIGGTFMGCGQVITWGEGVEGGDIAGPTGDLYPRSGYNPRADMAFIAAARTDVPALVAEVERLRAERERDRRIVELAKLWLAGNGARNHAERVAQLNALMDAIDASIPGEDF